MMGQLITAVVSASLVHVASFAMLPGEGHSAVAPASSIDASAVRNRVTGLAVTPSIDGVDVVVMVDSSSSVNHFSLDGPSRLVLDVASASLAQSKHAYDGVARGSVRNIRVAQFRADTVRIVIDLDAAHQYRLVRSAGSVRVAIDGPSTEFASWQSGSTAALATIERDIPRETAAIEVPVQQGELLGDKQLTHDEFDKRADTPALVNALRSESA